MLLFTARPHGVGPHHQKIWNLLVFQSGRLRLHRVRLLFFILRSLCSSSFTSRVRNLVHSLTGTLPHIVLLCPHMDSRGHVTRRPQEKLFETSTKATCPLLSQTRLVLIVSITLVPLSVHGCIRSGRPAGQTGGRQQPVETPAASGPWLSSPQIVSTEPGRRAPLRER